MRLLSVKGFELRDEFPRYENPSSSIETQNITTADLWAESTPTDTYRLVAYTSEQSSPVYISEKLVPSRAEPLVTNEISFTSSPSKRSFLLAVQLTTESKIVQEWILDLRLAKLLKNVKTPQSLLLLTDNGLMALPKQSKLGSPFSTEELSSGKSTATENFTRESTPNSGRSSIPETLGSLPNSPRQSLISRWLPSWSQSPSTLGINGGKTKAEFSLTYSMLVDLWTLQKILDEARVASLDLCSLIDKELLESALPIKEKETQLMERAGRIRRKYLKVGDEIADLKDRTSKIEHTCETQKSLLDGSFTCSANETGDVEMNRACHVRLEELETSSVTSLPSKIKQEQARLATELMEIFPIEPLADGKFHFAIRDLILPSVFAINHFDTTQIAAALGFVAQVVVCLSRYLAIPLPYPITVCGSQSYITDDISLIKHGSTKFPLWTRGALLYRVEYALYLLHKDIDQLMGSLGLAVADLKQTLANLKNLLLVVSSRVKQ